MSPLVEEKMQIWVDAGKRPDVDALAGIGRP